ncbi:hypothetical protein D1614_02630 [Maribellus luteus]|uniref:DUF5018 domain-containing protein n=1 Tax=Maribellus luteus TaxID=2305463 RepID=A0A399T7I4_9BACT|nr:hypothetical protein [Maribellus luteus]RIJ50835.1 hypothetical protein D1614_02630 [Maribellus luteus]
MKRIYLKFIAILSLAVSCVPSFDQEGELPDNPAILEIIVGNENGKLPLENAIDNDTKIDTIWIKDRTADYSNVYLRGNLAPGCVAVPLEGAPGFGKYGDFSKPAKYRITAPTGNSADWTVVLAEYIPPVGCLADRWGGDVTCIDGVWASYSPAACTGVKVNNDCQRVNITFAFWADGGAVVTLELQLGEIDFDTFTGELTLLNDVNFSSYGADMTFHAGPAGTYDATANILHLNLKFSGYDIGGEYYPFTVSQ